jgi:hypothetical protein
MEADPNQRTRMVGSTPIARVYHSTALLLPDGRVWVAGSNPGGAFTYPKEFRVEFYTPPYLAGNPARPEFHSIDIDLGWDAHAIVRYCQVFTIHVKLTNLNRINSNLVRYVVIMGGFVTHGNTPSI